MVSGSLDCLLFRDGDFLLPRRSGDLRLGGAVLVLARAGLFFFFAGEAAAWVLRLNGEDSAVPAEAAPRAADLRGDRRGEAVTPIVSLSSPIGIVLLLLLSVPISVRGPANAKRAAFVLLFVVDE